jgi:hypothetical protein
VKGFPQRFRNVVESYTDTKIQMEKARITGIIVEATEEI